MNISQKLSFTDKLGNLKLDGGDAQFSDENVFPSFTDYQDNYEYISNDGPVYYDYNRGQVQPNPGNSIQYVDQQQAYNNKFHRAKIKEMVNENTQDMRRLEADTNQLRNSIVNKFRNQQRGPLIEYSVNEDFEPGIENKRINFEPGMENKRKETMPINTHPFLTNGDRFQHQIFYQQLSRPNIEVLNRKTEFENEPGSSNGNLFQHHQYPQVLKNDVYSSLQSKPLAEPQLKSLSSPMPMEAQIEKDETILQQTPQSSPKPLTKVADIDLPSENQQQLPSPKPASPNRYDEIVPDLFEPDKQWPIEIQAEELKDRKRYLSTDKDSFMNFDFPRQTRKSKNTCNFGDDANLQGKRKSSISINFKNLKDFNSDSKKIKDKEVRKVMDQCYDEYDNEDDGEDNNKNKKNTEDTDSECDDCNSDEDESDSVIDEYEEQEEQQPDPIKVPMKKNKNEKLKVTALKGKNNKLNEDKGSILLKPNKLKGGQQYYNNRALDERWKHINSNNNRFKGGYRENMGKSRRFYERNSPFKNGKRKIKLMSNIAGECFYFYLSNKNI